MAEVINPYIMLLNEIEKLFQDADMETRLLEESGILMLKARLTGLGRAQGEALMEICVPDTPFQGIGGEPLAFLQIYTTLASNIDEINFAPVCIALNNYTPQCPLGALHLFQKQHQLYHLYQHILRGTQLLDFSGGALDAVNLVVGVLENIFDDIIVIADNAKNSRYF